jgi:hypothetical protein
MKKIVILLVAAIALLSFSCNKYCKCKDYIDGELVKEYKGEFIKESSSSCENFGTEPRVLDDGKTHETKCTERL